MMKSLYLTNRFYYLFTGLIVLFFLSYFAPGLYIITQLLVLFFVVATTLDGILLYRKNGIIAHRNCPDKFSNGDKNEVIISIDNQYDHDIDVQLIDELPIILQQRDTEWKLSIKSKDSEQVQYFIRPVKRGNYQFGSLNVFASTFFRLVRRRYQFDVSQDVKVYPSYLKLKEYEMKAFSQKRSTIGNRRLRRIGQTMEFEQIKQYVRGDDPRHINWKASARSDEVMLNQYADEKSQQVICIVDKGRLMKSPFDGLSLLDYAINGALAVCHIILKKDDKAGLITFSNKLSTVELPAKRKGQMQRIFEHLFNQRTNYKEANYELLNSYISRKINQRSLLLLFANFETYVGFKRQLPYLKKLGRKHLLVIIFFENTELQSLAKSKPKNREDIYIQTMGRALINEKQKIIKELKINGIVSVLTKPQDLSMKTINKYVEIKKRHML